MKRASGTASCDPVTATDEPLADPRRRGVWHATGRGYYNVPLFWGASRPASPRALRPVPALGGIVVPPVADRILG